MQLWLKWREIWKEWKEGSNTPRHCPQGALSDSVCPLSKTDRKWFARCPCEPGCELHHNRPINGPSVFIVPASNIDEWFAAINKYVDLKALGIKVLPLHKSLPSNGVNLWNVKNQLQTLVNPNLKRPTGRNPLLEAHYGRPSEEITFIWIVSTWETYHMRIPKEFTSIHVEKWMERKTAMKKEIVMSTMHVGFACVDESHNVKNMRVGPWKDLGQMKDERPSQRFWLVPMSGTLISADPSDIIGALDIASSPA